MSLLELGWLCILLAFAGGVAAVLVAVKGPSTCHWVPADRDVVGKRLKITPHPHPRRPKHEQRMLGRCVLVRAIWKRGDGVKFAAVEDWEGVPTVILWDLLGLGRHYHSVENVEICYAAKCGFNKPDWWAK